MRRRKSGVFFPFCRRKGAGDPRLPAEQSWARAAQRPAGPGVAITGPGPAPPSWWAAPPPPWAHRAGGRGGSGAAGLGLGPGSGSGPKPGPGASLAPSPVASQHVWCHGARRRREEWQAFGENKCSRTQCLIVNSLIRVRGLICGRKLVFRRRGQRAGSRGPAAEGRRCPSARPGCQTAAPITEHSLKHNKHRFQLCLTC